MIFISSIARVLRSGLDRFPLDRGGNAATMFALSLVPIIGMVGFAVDYSNANRIKAQLQNTLDSAALAGAQAVARNDPNPSAVVTQFVSSSFRANGLVPTVSVAVQNTGSVTVNASVVVPNYFMKFVGTPNSTVLANSQATYGSGKLEVALVLDVTYSMTGTKLSTAQAAANNLIDTLFALPDAASRVKIGLVPFTYYVNVGTTYAGATWLTSTAPVSTPVTYSSTTCTGAATYSTTLTPATCTSDGVPYDCSYYAQLTPATGCSTTTSSGTWTYTWNGCVGSRNSPLDLTDTVALTNPVPALVTDSTKTWSYSCANPLQRLTTDSAGLKSQVNALVAQQETFIAPGLLWGWRVLSPNPPFADGAAYNTSTKKAIVLMTDGANTHSPYYPDHEDTNVTTANNITTQTCAAIKAQNIAIYAIAFQVTDVTIKGILQNCATSVSYYYDATTLASLTNAFASIGQQMTALRLTQ